MNIEKIHPFEAAGMDIGPYKWIGMWSHPSHELAEANPAAYSNALANQPRNIDGGCGTCRHCGMAIIHNHIIESSTGKRFAVGCDCVRKTGDKSIGDMAKVAEARRIAESRRQLADARREQQRQRWLATVCNASGETNADRLVREDNERKQAQSEAKNRGLQWAWLTSVLRDGRGGFRDSISTDLENGGTISGKAMAICCDIYAKQFGRYGSNAYQKAEIEFQAKVSQF